MKKMIAYCGLDCEKCDAYIATVNNDQNLREKTAKLWSKLNDVSILPEAINCLGCRADGIKTGYCENICDIRKCAIKREIETCSKCSEFKNCNTIQTFLLKNSEDFKN